MISKHLHLSQDYISIAAKKCVQVAQKSGFGKMLSTKTVYFTDIEPNSLWGSGLHEPQTQEEISTCLK